MYTYATGICCYGLTALTILSPSMAAVHRTSFLYKKNRAMCYVESLIAASFSSIQSAYYRSYKHSNLWQDDINSHCIITPINQKCNFGAQLIKVQRTRIVRKRVHHQVWSPDPPLKVHIWAWFVCARLIWAYVQCTVETLTDWSIWVLSSLHLHIKDNINPLNRRVIN